MVHRGEGQGVPQCSWTYGCIRICIFVCFSQGQDSSHLGAAGVCVCVCPGPGPVVWQRVGSVLPYATCATPMDPGCLPVSHVKGEKGQAWRAAPVYVCFQLLLAGRVKCDVRSF